MEVLKAGLPILLKKWPNAVPIATSGTINHIHESIKPEEFDAAWEGFFPNKIARPFVIPRALPDDRKEFLLAGKWRMQAIECGQTDTWDTTVLWVPDLRLVVAGDVVYGGCHQMLRWANTPAKRANWIRAIEIVEALDPMHVVPGHKIEGEMDGAWHLAATKKYIEDFGRLVEKGPKSKKELATGMMELYPDRFNTGALLASVQGAFQRPQGESKM